MNANVSKALGCDSDRYCESFWPDSGTKCVDGQCSNPFASGCFRAMEAASRRKLFGASEMLEDTLYSKRICNSNDEASSDLCEPAPFDFPEIVIHNANWDSTILYSWIMQIFLMEFLQVPAKVGLGFDSQEASFYNLENTVSYSSEAYPFGGIETANKFRGECTATEEQCVHVLPEVWNGQERSVEALFNEGQIDAVHGNGMVGQLQWYVPAFTARNHSKLITFHGLSNNREELAEVFKRPTTWKHYCEELSESKCLQPDPVAKRYPSQEEDDMYYQKDVFTGYFRHTSESNCTLNPNTCTGHIVAPPCSWSTDIEAQTYWLDIALKSNGSLTPNDGYAYEQMLQIWWAAAETGSHVIMWWYKPDGFPEIFRGTPAEFQAVMLPETTTTCRNNRISGDDRCHSDVNVRRGKELGACGQEPHMLNMVVASSLRDNSLSASEVEQSPAYQAIKNFRIDDLDLGDMLTQWAKEDQTGQAARDIVCQYVVDHQEQFSNYIPRGFPRKVITDPASFYSGTLFVIAKLIASASIVYVMVMALAVHKYKGEKVFVYAQPFFVKMVLFGLFLIAISSILYTANPSDGVCASQVWFQLYGYTLLLVPLIVKISAINRLMSATKKMRRVKITPNVLYCKVMAWMLLVTIFLIVYQTVDPPSIQYWSFLEKSDSFEDPDTIRNTIGCGGESFAFDYCVIGFEFFLIIFATVLAYQSRNTQSDFNESKKLGLMIYSHFIFVALRGILFAFFETDIASTNGESFGPATISAVNSILMSLDVLSATSIYVLSKVLKARKGGDPKGKDKSKLGSKGSSGFKGSAAVQAIEEEAKRAQIAYASSQGSAQYTATQVATISGLSNPPSAIVVDTKTSNRPSFNTEVSKLSLDLSMKQGGIVDEETPKPETEHGNVFESSSQDQGKDAAANSTEDQDEKAINGNDGQVKEIASDENIGNTLGGKDLLKNSDRNMMVATEVSLNPSERKSDSKVSSTNSLKGSVKKMMFASRVRFKGEEEATDKPVGEQGNNPELGGKKKMKGLVKNMMFTNLFLIDDANKNSDSESDNDGAENKVSSAPNLKKASSTLFKSLVNNVIFSNLKNDAAVIEYESSSEEEPDDDDYLNDNENDDEKDQRPTPKTKAARPTTPAEVEKDELLESFNQLMTENRRLRQREQLTMTGNSDPSFDLRAKPPTSPSLIKCESERSVLSAS